MSLRRSCHWLLPRRPTLAVACQLQVTSALMAIANYLERQLACTRRHELERHPVTRNT